MVVEMSCKNARVTMTILNPKYFANGNAITERIKTGNARKSAIT